MRFLGIGRLFGVAARRIGQVVAAEIRTNRVANFSYRFGRNVDAVCPHIGDEAGHFAVNLHPFIEALGDLHGAAGRIAQLTRGFLLQGRGCKGRRGIALARLALDVFNAETGGTDGGFGGMRLGFICQ